jgi:sterol 14-demethylase
MQDGVEVVTDASQIAKGGKLKWVPFGAGRHRCIGFEFAQIQIRCIWSVILRDFEISMTESEWRCMPNSAWRESFLFFSFGFL